MRGPFAVMVPAALRYRGWETSVTSSPVSDAACPIRVVCSATLPPVRRPASSMVRMILWDIFDHSGNNTEIVMQ